MVKLNVSARVFVCLSLLIAYVLSYVLWDKHIKIAVRFKVTLWAMPALLRVRVRARLLTAPRL